MAFSSVDAFNEPASGWWTATGSQEGCHFDPATQAAVVPLLRAELDKRALPRVRVAASDENSYDLALSTWRAFPAASRKAVGQINVHGYQEGSGDRAGLYTAAQQAGVVLRNSEYGDGDGSGLGLAANLNLDFAQLHPTAWVYWQAFDGGGWGLVQGDNDRASVGAPNPKYFVLAHYSRHIRPGDTIVAGGDGGNTVAATSARAGGTLVLVRLNQGAAQSTKFDLSGLGVTPGAAVPRWCTQPDDKEGERYARHDDTTVGVDGSFIAEFGKNTICTFEVPMKKKKKISASPPWNSTSCYHATLAAPCPTPTSLHCSFVSPCDPTKKNAVTNDPTGYSCCVKTGGTYMPTYLQVCDGGGAQDYCIANPAAGTPLTF